MIAMKKGIWRFSNRLPKIEEAHKLTLGEGDTPLVKLRDLNLYAKVEAVNPTGSFKDRGAAFLASKLGEEGCRSVVIDSSGNAAVSTSAYCAHASIKHIAVMPKYSHMEKKVNILWHGSRVVEVPDRNAARVYARTLAKELGYRYIGFAVEENAILGLKTTAYELQEDFTPDAILIPVGAANNLVAIGRAYLEMEKQGEIERIPQLHAVQSAACAPIAGEFTDYVKEDSTLAEGVIVPYTERREEAVSLVRRTGGTGWVVRDEEILKAVSLLASNGIYTSPTGAVALAGAAKARLKGKVICIVTDTGLKSNMMMEEFKKRTFKVESEEDLKDLLELLRGI
jgi:threonine synthase